MVSQTSPPKTYIEISSHPNSPSGASQISLSACLSCGVSLILVCVRSGILLVIKSTQALSACDLHVSAPEHSYVPSSISGTLVHHRHLCIWKHFSYILSLFVVLMETAQVNKHRRCLEHRCLVHNKNCNPTNESLYYD